jgi:hypothetical protein
MAPRTSKQPAKKAAPKAAKAAKKAAAKPKLAKNRTMLATAQVKIHADKKTNLHYQVYM